MCTALSSRIWGIERTQRTWFRELLKSFGSAGDKVENEKSKSYLFTIAYNQMIDHIRKNKRISLKDDFADSAKGATTQKHDAKRILNEALAKLSEQQRSLVLLKDYEGYSYDEIGQITGLNESQVKVYLHRARLQLREYIISPENVI